MDVKSTLGYTQQDSTQTLEQGLLEYYEANPGLLDPSSLPRDTELLFRQHDAGHVVFGCDTSIRGEALIDTWTVLGTTTGLSGYLEYFKHPQVNDIFAEVGYWRIFVESVRCTPDLAKVLIRSRRLTARWPWKDYESYLSRSLLEIRREFRIRVL